jgi:hypothetical protein
MGTESVFNVRVAELTACDDRVVVVVMMKMAGMVQTYNALTQLYVAEMNETAPVVCHLYLISNILQPC